MANKSDTSYQDSEVQWFQAYLEISKEHQNMMESLDNILPSEFKTIGQGKRSLDVLGVGSGGGQKDVHMLTLLQSTFPGVPISAEIIEASVKLSNNFKALVAKTPNLSTVPFSWNMMLSEDYMQQAKGDMKKFDFIHMIQMIYYVKDLPATLKFYHGLLKKNGRLMIIVVGKCAWEILWKTVDEELCIPAFTEQHSAETVKTQLDKMNLKYEEHLIPADFDISECFDPNSKVGNDLVNFFYYTLYRVSPLTPETREVLLDILKNKCSKQKDGKIMFHYNMSCIIVNA